MSSISDTQADRAAAATLRARIAELRAALVEAEGACERLAREAEMRVERLGRIAQDHASWSTRLSDADRQIGELHRSKAGTWRGVLWVLASKLVTWTATMVLISAVGVAVAPHLVIGVLSVGVLIQWIASIVPLGLGLADGGNYALFDLLGASGAHGAFVTMLNRVRSALVALAGFVVMAIVHTLNRLALTRMRRKLRELREAHPE